MFTGGCGWLYECPVIRMYRPAGSNRASKRPTRSVESAERGRATLDSRKKLLVILVSDGHGRGRSPD
jgi:hypothetical protein